MDIVEEMRGFSEDHEPDGWPGVRMHQITALCDEIDRLRAEVAELRGVATLAYRALDDSYRVLSTIDGDDTHEQFELGMLAKRVQDVSVSLFVVLRQNDAALAKDSSHE